MGEMSQEKRIEVLQKLCKEYTKAQDVKGVLRCKALLAWYKGMEQRTIQSCLGLGRKALKRWRKRFEAEGSVSDRERRGRPPKLPVEQAEQMKALIMEQKQRVWTVRHVFVVLQTVFGVVYSVKYLP